MSRIVVNRWVSRLDENSNDFVTSDSNAYRRKNNSCCSHSGLLSQVGKDLVCSHMLLYTVSSIIDKKELTP